MVKFIVMLDVRFDTQNIGDMEIKMNSIKEDLTLMNLNCDNEYLIHKIAPVVYIKKEQLEEAFMKYSALKEGNING